MDNSWMIYEWIDRSHGFLVLGVLATLSLILLLAYYWTIKDLDNGHS